MLLGLLGRVLPLAVPRSWARGSCPRGTRLSPLLGAGRRGREKKKGGLFITTETEGAVVSFFQAEAKELLENIVVSIGVAAFKCG